MGFDNIYFPLLSQKSHEPCHKHTTSQCKPESDLTRGMIWTLPWKRLRKITLAGSLLSSKKSDEGHKENRTTLDFSLWTSVRVSWMRELALQPVVVGNGMEDTRYRVPQDSKIPTSSIVVKSPHSPPWTGYGWLLASFYTCSVARKWLIPHHKNV